MFPLTRGEEPNDLEGFALEAELIVRSPEGQKKSRSVCLVIKILLFLEASQQGWLRKVEEKKIPLPKSGKMKS